MVAWLHACLTQGSVALLLHNGRKWWQRYGNQEDPEKASDIYNLSKHFCGTSGSKPRNDGSWQLTGFLFNGEYWHQTPSFAREQLREQATIAFSAVDVLQSYGRQFPRLTPEKGSVGAPKRHDWMRKVLFHLFWHCSRPTSCSPHFPHPLSFLPPVHHPRPPSLGSGPPQPFSVSLPRWTPFLPGDRHTLQPVNSYIRTPLSSHSNLRSRVLDHQRLRHGGATVNTRASAQIDHPSRTLIFVEAAHTRTLLPHSNAAHQHSLRHAGEAEKTPCSASKPQPLCAAGRK